MRHGFWMVQSEKDGKPHFQGGQLKCGKLEDLIEVLTSHLADIAYTYVEFLLVRHEDYSIYGYKIPELDWQILQLSDMKGGGFVTSQLGAPNDTSKLCADSTSS